MDFNRMRVTTKLWIFIGLILALIVSVAGVGLNRSAGIISKGNAAQDVALETARIAAQWNALTEANSVRNHAIILSSGTTVTDAFKDAVKTTSEQISELQKKLESMPLHEVDKAHLQEVGDLRKPVISLREKARALKLEDKHDEALQVFNAQYMPAVQAYIAAQRDFVKMQDTRVQEIQVATEQKRQENARFILVGLAVVLVLIFAGTTWLVGSIRDPLAQANAMAARIARGDLSAQVRVNRHDEFGELLRSFATMNESLARMVTEIRSGTDQIATASAEISSGNNDLASRTEQTSSNLQSTASSMDSLTGTVQHSADSARQASTLASSASEVAQRGGSMVMQVVSTMQDIDSSSKKIADIISVIDGIAFQTNILALNAAVEAARAGEQGRGFAVVASEVRSLAGRSAEAAREIKALINASVERVESGTRLVSDAGETMQEIVQSVRRVADVIGEITADVTEQSSGIAGVNQAISQLDQMTQQNAALVEESAAAAESLRDQADRMKQAVAVFTV